MVFSIDIGSSSVRAGVFDRDGLAVQGLSSARAHSPQVLPGGGSEVDPERLFQLVIECIDDVSGMLDASGAGHGRAVEAVAVCSFWHSLLAVDREGRPLGPLTTWADSRSAAETELLATDLDEEAVRARVGCVFNPSYFPARILRCRMQEPDVFERVAWWCSFGEYFFWRLFGKKLCSISMASGSGLLDQTTCAWDRDLLDYLRLDESKLSVLEDLDVPLGGLREPFTGRWPGLRSVPWFPAMGDGACSNIGCGCVGQGRAAVMVGTSGAMRVIIPDGSVAGLRLPRGLWRYRVDGRRILAGGVLGNGGNVFEWLRSTLAVPADPAGMDSALLEREAACHGLVMLPFFTGERSVGWRPRARAAVMGMSLDTTPLDLVQAGMEAVAYNFAAVQRLLDSAFAPARLTVATGGALVRSRAWTQIIADVLERPVTLSRATEASSRGAALLALEALGRIRDICEPEPLLGEVFAPREERRVALRAAAQRQERVSRLLDGI